MTTTIQADEFVRLAEAAASAGVSRTTLHVAAQRGELSYAVLDGVRHWQRGEVARWAAARQEAKLASDLDAALRAADAAGLAHLIAELEAELAGQRLRAHRGEADADDATLDDLAERLGRAREALAGATS